MKTLILKPVRRYSRDVGMFISEVLVDMDFPGARLDRETRDHFDRDDSECPIVYFRALVDGKLVGCSSLLLPPRGGGRIQAWTGRSHSCHAEITRVAVRPDFRDMGLGRLLFARPLAYARAALGLDSVVTCVNARQTRLMEMLERDLGFSPTDELLTCSSFAAERGATIQARLLECFIASTTVDRAIQNAEAELYGHGFDTLFELPRRRMAPSTVWAPARELQVG